MELSANRLLLSPLIACLLAVSLGAAPARAQEDEPPPVGPPRDAWTIIPEGRLLLEYDSNALQLPGFGADTLGKLFAGATVTYDFPSDSQLLGQLQEQVWRYAEQPIFNVALTIFTLQAAQKFDVLGLKVMDSISPFVGGQVVYKQPTGAGVSRVDFNLLAGFTALKTFGGDKVLVGGYQFSNLLADVPQTAYSAHSLNMLYRMVVLPRWVNLTATYQLQLRVPWDVDTPKQLRNTLGLSFQFMPVQGMSINVGGDFTDQFAAPLPWRIGYYSFNVSIGTDTLLGLP